VHAVLCSALPSRELQRPLPAHKSLPPKPTAAGVELGGALKNVLAIACGISDGLKFGSNARAALITRGGWIETAVWME